MVRMGNIFDNVLMTGSVVVSYWPLTWYWLRVPNPKSVQTDVNGRSHFQAFARFDDHRSPKQKISYKGGGTEVMCKSIRGILSPHENVSELQEVVKKWFKISNSSCFLSLWSTPARFTSTQHNRYGLSELRNAISVNQAAMHTLLYLETFETKLNVSGNNVCE